MADDLDALFDLFEDKDATEGLNITPSIEPGASARAHGDATALPVPQQAEANDVDMLLSLADEITTETLPAAPAVAKHAAKQSFDGTAAARSGRPTAICAAPSQATGANNLSSLGTVAPVRMSQTKAFKSMNRPGAEPNKPNSNSQSGTDARATQQQSCADCQHFVEKLTGLKVNRKTECYHIMATAL